MAIGTTAAAAGIVESNVKILGNTPADTSVYSSGQVDTIVDHLAAKVTQVMNYKGIVQIPEGHESDADGGVAAALATIASPTHGDLYNVGGNLNNDNYVWNATANAWDKMASSFSLPDYLANTALEAKYLQIANAGALATKSEVAESDLASALASKINAKAEQSALTTLDGEVVKSATVSDQGAFGATNTDNVLAITGVAKATELTAVAGRVTTLEGTVGDASSGLVKDVADLKAVGAQANVLEGVQFKGSGASEFSDLTIDSNKKVQIDLSAYALTSAVTAVANDLDTLEGVVGTDSTGLMGRVKALEDVGAQENVLEGILFKGNGDSSSSELAISGKKVTLDLSSYALSSEIKIDTIQVKHNGAADFVTLSPESGTKTVKLDLSSYLKAADIAYPVTDVQVKGSGAGSFATVMDGTVAKVDLSAYAKTADLPVTDVQVKPVGGSTFATVMEGATAKIDLSGCFSKTAGDLATYRIAQIAGVVKKTKVSITLYDLYDMVAAIIDAAAATQA